MEKLINGLAELDHSLQTNLLQDHTVKLNLHFLKKTENDQYSQLINKHKNPCGCATGSQVLLLSGIGCIILCAFKISFFDTTLVKQIIFSFLSIMVLTAMGKIAGILYSNFKISAILSSLKEAQDASITLSC